MGDTEVYEPRIRAPSEPLVDDVLVFIIDVLVNDKKERSTGVSTCMKKEYYCQHARLAQGDFAHKKVPLLRTI